MTAAPGPELVVTSAHRSDVGRVRRHNEDAVLDGTQIWAVADGMGGHAAGEVASALVIEALTPLDGRAGLSPADVVAAVREAHGRIVAHGIAHPAARGLGSTVSGVARVQVDGARPWAVFNVGDSRVYRFRDGVLQRATIDHSEAEELVLEGVITPEQARTHRSRHLVTRSLGQPGTPPVDLWLLPASPGERFLVCSDGLPGEVGDDTLAVILADADDPAAASAALVADALRHGGRDNVSVIVVDVAPGAAPEAGQAGQAGR